MKLAVARWTLACAAVGLLAGCGDGTPAFCSTLEENSDVAALGTAIADGDLDMASAEAQRLVDVAEEAPPEIREDLRSIGGAVGDIVDHLRASTDQAADSSETERARDRLNDRLGELEPRIGRVERWAQRNCGLDLS